MAHLTPEQVADRAAADAAFTRAGHAPENTNCDHSEYNFDLHGRYCPSCGTSMVDFGD